MLDPLGVVIKSAQYLGAVAPENMFHRLSLADQDMRRDQCKAERKSPAVTLQIRQL